MKIFSLLLMPAVFFVSMPAKAQYHVAIADSSTFQLGDGVVLSKTSFRGLSVVDDHTIWVSGSRGTIAKSTDGGKTFSYTQLKGYEKSDFRDIEAFDAKRAVIMSSGTPAYILKTTDGGNTWKEVYKNTDSAYFLDAMDFWNEQQGVLVGDPVDGHFVLLQTEDGGGTWKQLDTSVSPRAAPGEAVFAASGTSLRCWGDHKITFVSGGAQSTLFYKLNKTNSWEKRPIPINKGASGQGAFSITLFMNGYNRQLFLISGGDYMKDSFAQNNFAVYRPEPSLWFSPKLLTCPNGYRSCIEQVSENAVVSCGTTGVDLVVFEKGEEVMHEWRLISGEAFHVVRKAKKGKAVFLAGPKGKIAKLVD